MAAKSKMSKLQFMINALIGEGGFGLVLSGMNIVNREWYAIKEINKYNLLQHKTGLDMIFGELCALKKLRHPFIVRLNAAFHDAYVSLFLLLLLRLVNSFLNPTQPHHHHHVCACRSAVYLVLDLKTGGDLRYYLRKKIVFSERDVAFYVSCLSSALAHIHSMKVLHRDIKPENILLDSKGYPHLAGVPHSPFHRGASHHTARAPWSVYSTHLCILVYCLVPCLFLRFPRFPRFPHTAAPVRVTPQTSVWLTCSPTTAPTPSSRRASAAGPSSTWRRRCDKHPPGTRQLPLDLFLLPII